MIRIRGRHRFWVRNMRLARANNRRRFRTRPATLRLMALHRTCCDPDCREALFHVAQCCE